MKIWRAFWAALLLGGGCCWGAPAASSAAVDAGAKMDLSSPKAAVRSLYEALRAGDLAGARRCLRFKSVQDEENFDLCVTPLWLPLRLMHAMETKFGPGARRPFACVMLEKSVDQALEDLGRAEAYIEGDKAVIAEKRAAVDPNAETEITGITLRRRGDQWQVEAETFGDLTAEIPALQVETMRGLRNAVVAACESTLSRLEKGEYKSAEEAYAAYERELQAEALKAENRRSRIEKGVATSREGA